MPSINGGGQFDDGYAPQDWDDPARTTTMTIRTIPVYTDPRALHLFPDQVWNPANILARPTAAYLVDTKAPPICAYCANPSFPLTNRTVRAQTHWACVCKGAMDEVEHAQRKDKLLAQQLVDRQQMDAAAPKLPQDALARAIELNNAATKEAARRGTALANLPRLQLIGGES